MPTKDKITPGLKYAMLNSVKKTKESGNEHGFLICEDKDGKWSASGTKCDGDSCGIILKKKEDCMPLKKIGSFHTHIKNEEVLLSLQDIKMHLLIHEDLVSCVGTKKEIACFQSYHPDSFYKNEDVFEFNKNILREERLNEGEYIDDNEKEEYFNYSNKIFNKYFRTVCVKATEMIEK